MTCTLLPIEIFRQQIGHNPWHFFQLADVTHVPLTDGCNTLLREYSWQTGGAAGREEIREAIKVAEERLQDYLKFSIAPHYVTENLDVGCLQHQATGNGVASWWGAGYLTLKEGRVSQIATETLELIQDNIAVQFSDTDGDGLFDYFEIQFADTTTDPKDIEIYFDENDRLTGLETDLCRWQIRPVTVQRYNASTLAAYGRVPWLLVKPLLYEGAGVAPGYNNDPFGRLDTNGALDPTNPANYISTLSAYKRVLSNTNQATLFYNDGCGTETSFTVCATLADRKTGLVSLQPGGACPCTCGFSFYDPFGYYYPTSGYALAGMPAQSVRLEINYRAGETLADWQTIVTRLALAELRKRICPCDEANAEVFRWQTDLARANGVMVEQYRISNEDLENPLGTRAGQVYAWQRIQRLSMRRAINLG